ncbi:MAG: glycosyltransferase family 2 protein [Candidatus Omnitrophica bacterium]|nr:glycosyltransferase family 2 protein [Candidatus Omnitrophota bacterium]
MISVIVPAFNEEGAIESVLRDIDNALGNFADYEIIVVNDGSTDKTAEGVKKAKVKNLSIISHVENLGYGKSLYDGILAAKYSCIAIIDGDGSYPAASILELYKYYPQYHMVIGARKGREYGKGIVKRCARILFTHLVEYASGRKVLDVNSGLRIFNKDIVMKFQDSLCTGFSFTTTLTLIFSLNHYYIKYVPVEYMERKGKSKVRHFKDTLRAGQIIVETILYYNPVKLFLLFATVNAGVGIVLEVLNYVFFKSTFLTIISALCITSFLPIFGMGLIADQLKKIYKLNK